LPVDLTRLLYKLAEKSHNKGDIRSGNREMNQFANQTPVSGDILKRGTMIISERRIGLNRSRRRSTPQHPYLLEDINNVFLLRQNNPILGIGELNPNEIPKTSQITQSENLV
jgi:hypothetical protein